MKVIKWISPHIIVARWKTIGETIKGVNRIFLNFLRIKILDINLITDEIIIV